MFSYWDNAGPSPYKPHLNRVKRAPVPYARSLHVSVVDAGPNSGDSFIDPSPTLY